MVNDVHSRGRLCYMGKPGQGTAKTKALASPCLAVPSGLPCRSPNPTSVGLPFGKLTALSQSKGNPCLTVLPEFVLHGLVALQRADVVGAFVAAEGVDFAAAYQPSQEVAGGVGVVALRQEVLHQR